MWKIRLYSNRKRVQAFSITLLVLLTHWGALKSLRWILAPTSKDHSHFFINPDALIEIDILQAIDQYETTASPQQLQSKINTKSQLSDKGSKFGSVKSSFNQISLSDQPRIIANLSTDSYTNPHTISHLNVPLSAPISPTQTLNTDTLKPLWESIGKYYEENPEFIRSYASFIIDLNTNETARNTPLSQSQWRIAIAHNYMENESSHLKLHIECIQACTNTQEHTSQKYEAWFEALPPASPIRLVPLS